MFRSDGLIRLGIYSFFGIIIHLWPGASEMICVVESIGDVY